MALTQPETQQHQQQQSIRWPNILQRMVDILAEGVRKRTTAARRISTSHRHGRAIINQREELEHGLFADTIAGSNGNWVAATIATSFLIGMCQRKSTVSRNCYNFLRAIAPIHCHRVGRRPAFNHKLIGNTLTYIVTKVAKLTLKY